MKRASRHLRTPLFVLALVVVGLVAGAPAAGQFFCQTCSADNCINVHPDDEWGYANCFFQNVCRHFNGPNGSEYMICYGECRLTEPCILPPPPG